MGFKWKTHDGRLFAPKAMASSHLFHCIRMMFNNIMPPALRIDPGQFIRWPDVKHWDPQYIETATTELTKELKQRSDYWQYQGSVEDMEWNAQLLQRMQEGRVLSIHLS